MRIFKLSIAIVGVLGESMKLIHNLFRRVGKFHAWNHLQVITVRVSYFRINLKKIAIRTSTESPQLPEILFNTRLKRVSLSSKWILLQQ